VSGANLVNANTDLIGGQASNQNQFANLFSQIGRQMNQGGTFNQNRQQARPSIRIPLKMAFTPRVIPTSQITAKFENRISKLSGITSVGPIKVTMEGPVAVLQGVVKSEQDRELAAGVAMLEPEVESVRNELTVEGVETSSSDSAGRTP